ncbi:MAG: glycosyltransferase family 39 protein [Crocinitomicaceae bacterium]|nr:glycosyltransferase family 39 protein [Crocinitomicaceae bacterium]
MINNLKHNRIYLLLGLAWVVALLIINPTGEFPLSDDWAYSQNVYHLSEKGELYFSSWPGMTLIVQTLWGAFFCKVFGFSFLILRVSTIVLSIVTSVVFMSFVLKLTGKRKLALYSTFALLFTPLYLMQSMTFMTEIHFLTFFISALYCYYRFFQTEHIKYILFAVVFVLLSILVRQTGLVLPIAFGVVWSICKRFEIKSIVLSIVPIFVGLLVLYVYKTLRFEGQVEGAYTEFSELFKIFNDFDPFFIPVRLGVIAFYLSLFLLPMIVSVSFKGYTINKRRIILFFVISLFVTLCMYTARNAFPTGNVISTEGIGIKLLKDLTWGDNVNPLVGQWFINALEIFLIIVMNYILFFLCTRKSFTITAETKGVRLLQGMLVVSGLGYLVYLSLVGLFFDRYVLPLIFLGILFLVTMRISARGIKRGYVLVLIFGGVSTLLIHDNFSWNRARWGGIEYLTDKENISPNNIDGGFEFNGWHQTAPRGVDEESKKSWWFVDDDTYVVAAGDIEGFSLYKTLPYQTLLPYETDTLYILKKIE